MSTFGEIVEPISRAAWEDWDDIILDRNITSLEWKRCVKVPDEIHMFLIFEGKYLTDCLKLQTQHILELMDSVPQVDLQLFRVKNSKKYFCTIKKYNLIYSSEIIELLKPYFDVSQEVIAFQTKSLHEYQSSEVSHQDCIIRMVTTSKLVFPALGINFPKLEQPNIISGVSAGVVSLREHLDLSAVALVCYMEHPEEYLVEEIEELLEKLNIKQRSTTRPSSILNSNLYI